MTLKNAVLKNSVRLTVIALALLSLSVTPLAAAEGPSSQGSVFSLELDLWQWLTDGLSSIWQAVVGEESPQETQSFQDVPADDLPPGQEVGAGMVPIG